MQDITKFTDLIVFYRNSLIFIEIRWNFSGFCRTSKNSLDFIGLYGLHRTSRNSLNFIAFHRTLSDFIGLCRTLLDFIELEEFNGLQAIHRTSSDFVGLHRTSSDFVGLYWTLLDFIELWGIQRTFDGLYTRIQEWLPPRYK